MTGDSTGNDLSILYASRRGRVLSLLVLLWLLSVPVTTTAYITEVVFLGLVFVMLGVSWNLLAGYAGQISLGHAAFFGIGAFVSAWLTAPAQAQLPAWLKVHPLLTLPVAALAAALVALLVGPIIFRLTGHYFAIGTLALAAIIQLLLLDWRALSGGSTGFYVSRDLGVELPLLTGADLVFLVALAATVGMVLVTSRIVNSRAGLGMRAVHGDEGAASSLGVRPLAYKMYAFVVSSAMAGLAGGLYAQYTTYISAESTVGVVWMIDTLVVVILGGMGTMLGPVLGAGLFLLLDTALRSVVGGFATTTEGVLIILFMIFLPGGLYGLFRFRFEGDEDPPAETDAGDDDPRTEGEAVESDAARTE